MVSEEKMSRRIKLEVAYDGTNYCGWQIQPNGVTVQELLEHALSKVLKEEVRVLGASRTDAGVHASANVAVFDTDARIPAGRIAFAANTWLPRDIRVQSSIEVPHDFHPRFTDTIKTYEYKILHRTFPDPIRRLYSMHYYGPLDVEAMRSAAALLTGTHDFLSFCASTKDVKGTVRTIYKTELIEEGDMLTLRITGNGFLYHMVRIIAGTLLEVGKGSFPAGHVGEILAAKDRGAAGPTARACGLTLIGIRYPLWETQRDLS